MHGRLWVESEAGQGSTFHFHVTLGVASEEAGAEACSPLPSREALRGLPVLVVDDNRTNRQILTEVLTTWGLKPTAVDSSEGALKELGRAAGARVPYPLVVLDAMMPVMDGFALALRIKDDPILADCTLLMLSSADQPLSSTRCRELGIARCLFKPVRQSDLLEALLRACGEQQAEEAPTSVLPLPDRGPARPLHLLLAEDGLVNQRVAVGLLQMRGHTVVIANNGREAMEKVQGEKFDVVLMDVQMPEMDGLEATEAIRRRERATGTRVPIIAMTAHAMIGDRERCLAAGMDDYVSKPIRAQELTEALARMTSSPPAGVADEFPPDDVLNWAEALDHVAGDRNLLRELAAMVPDECRRLLAETHSALESGDVVRLRRAAHTMKGSMATFAARSAFTAAFRLENMGRNGDLNGADAAVAALEQEVARLLPALAAFVGPPRQAPGK